MTLLLAYLGERYPVERYLPLAVALAYVSLVPARALLPSALAIWLLLGALRLRDDLADLPSDRRAHPGRVLSGIQSPKALRALRTTAIGAALGSVLPLAAATRSVAGLPWLLALVAGLELAYTLRLPRKSHWVLLKYPAVLPILVASTSRPGNDVTLGARPVLYMAALLLVSMLVFEWSDDSGLKRHRFAPWVIALGPVVALAIASAHLREIGISASSIAAITGAFCVASLWALRRGDTDGSTYNALLRSSGKWLSLHCAVLAVGVATCERLYRGSHV